MARTTRSSSGGDRESSVTPNRETAVTPTRRRRRTLSRSNEEESSELTPRVVPFSDSDKFAEEHQESKTKERIETDDKEVELSKEPAAKSGSTAKTSLKPGKSPKSSSKKGKKDQTASSDDPEPRATSGSSSELPSPLKKDSEGEKQRSKSRQRRQQENDDDDAEEVTESLMDVVETPTGTPTGHKKTKENNVSESKGSSKRKHKKSSRKHTSKDSSEENPLAVVSPSNNNSSSVPPPTKRAPTVDSTVHRLRNLQYRPHPILCLSSSSSSSSMSARSSSHSYLYSMAVSRESGSVELYQHTMQQPKWRTVAVVAGRTDTPLTSLVWTTTTRSTEKGDETNSLSVLIGAHRQDLYVVDFMGTGQLVARTPVAGGGIYCVVCLGGTSLVAVGCQDGSIRILRAVVTTSQAATRDDDGDDDDSPVLQNRKRHRRSHLVYHLQDVATIPSAGAAILSLACASPTAHSGENQGSFVLFAGVADGTIRRYDSIVVSNKNSASRGASVETSFFASSGVQWRSTLRMTVECYGRNTPTRVWALCAASDGTVVSGDSLGHVQFWDGDNGTLIRSFDQNDVKADVLALAMNANETKVFASGVDSRVVCIERQPPTVQHETSGLYTKNPWILTHAQRPHTHDVKSMTIVKKMKAGSQGRTNKETEILCTGGIDTKLCTYHVAEFGMRRPRALYPWPSLKSPICAARAGRILSLLREDRVDLHELAPAPNRQEMNSPVLVSEESRTLAGTVQVKGSSNLACSAISSNGEILAMSDTYSLLLFSLRKIKKRDARTSDILPTKIDFELTQPCSVVALCFAQNSCLILVDSNDFIHIVRITSSDESQGGDQMPIRAVVQQTLPLSIGESHSSLFPVNFVISTEDGGWFAIARNSSGDEGGTIDIYKRTGKDDDCSYHSWWTLPPIGAIVTTVTFLERFDSSPFLAVACVNYALYLFDVSERRFSKWSEKAGYPLTTKLPSDLVSRNDYPVRIATNPASPSLVMMVRNQSNSCGFRVEYIAVRPFFAAFGLSPAPQ